MYPSVPYSFGNSSNTGRNENAVSGLVEVDPEHPRLAVTLVHRLRHRFVRISAEIIEGRLLTRSTVCSTGSFLKFAVVGAPDVASSGAW